MKTASPWEIYTTSVSEFLKKNLDSGDCDKRDTVYRGPDGSYGVGHPSVGQMDDSEIMEMVEDGQVSDWIG